MPMTRHIVLTSTACLLCALPHVASLVLSPKQYTAVVEDSQQMQQITGEQYEALTLLARDGIDFVNDTLEKFSAAVETVNGTTNDLLPEAIKAIGEITKGMAAVEKSVSAYVEKEMPGFEEIEKWLSTFVDGANKTAEKFVDSVTSSVAGASASLDAYASKVASIADGIFASYSAAEDAIDTISESKDAAVQRALGSNAAKAAVENRAAPSHKGAATSARKRANGKGKNAAHHAAPAKGKAKPAWAQGKNAAHHAAPAKGKAKPAWAQGKNAAHHAAPAKGKAAPARAHHATARAHALTQLAARASAGAMRARVHADESLDLATLRKGGGGGPCATGKQKIAAANASLAKLGEAMATLNSTAQELIDKVLATVDAGVASVNETVGAGADVQFFENDPITKKTLTDAVATFAELPASLKEAAGTGLDDAGGQLAEALAALAEGPGVMDELQARLDEVCSMAVNKTDNSSSNASRA
eukprot:TRINITY_DN6172_c0_g1_i1.p1 TRINITY_DN6172_c0_g1~~TRINITY_DN6172_c0_g1_i1.p1  ORF type:complete len:474 (-),score=124.21 TRINITY_DN6172_c0_g1_i1:41-1462(-)